MLLVYGMQTWWRGRIWLSVALMSFVTGSMAQPSINTLYPPALSDRAGDHVAYLVSATASSGALSYAWYQTGNSSVLSTSNVLVLTNIQPSNAGSYYVVVTDARGPTQSPNVTLNVLPPARWPFTQPILSWRAWEMASSL